MLDLKGYLETHTPLRAHQQKRACISSLPPEVLDSIIEILYNDNGNQIEAIAPASRVCRQFRKSAVPLLFRTTSCVVRENDGDRSRHVYTKILDISPLLQHVKTLCIRKALRTSDDAAAAAATDALEHQEVLRWHDMQCMRQNIARMPQLQLVRVRCSLASAVDLLTILRELPKVAVHFDYVGRYQSKKLFDNLKQLLDGRTVGLGIFYVPYDLSSHEDATPAPYIKSLRAIALDVDRRAHAELAFNSFLAGLNSQPFPTALSTLEELWLSLNAKYVTPQIGWNELTSTIPWSQLRRLSMHGPTIQMRLASILPRLKSLRCLRLRAEKLLPFHHNCPYVKNAVYSDINHPFFEIDFAYISSLTSLSIEGICNHIPIQNVVAPSLRSLKLHRPFLRVSVLAGESQRSPADLIRIAKVSPRMEKLELDIGYIENLWHPTAIPGVDVDTELYRFLAALAHFKDLRFVRLFPPYVSRQSTSGSSGRAPEYRQPCSDAQAIRLYNHLRQQNPRLSFFSISPATSLRHSVLPSQAMTWEVRSWGDKTMLTTRQLGKEYELRQTWVGERKVSSEVKRDSYHKGMGEDDDEGWVLQYP